VVKTRVKASVEYLYTKGTQLLSLLVTLFGENLFISWAKFTLKTIIHL